MDETGPKAATRWVIIAPDGGMASGWRDRETGAWADAAHKIGGPSYNRRNRDFDLKAQKVFIQNLKNEGYLSREREKISTRQTRNVTDKKGIDEYLHVRFSEDDLIALDKLIKLFTKKGEKPTKSWIVRKLIYDAVSELKL